jgi:hypothetical protein
LFNDSSAALPSNTTSFNTGLHNLKAEDSYNSR